MENYKLYMQKFKIALAIIVGTLFLTIFFIAKTVPEFQKVFNVQKEYKKQAVVLAESERKLQSIEALTKEKIIKESKLVKAFFKPVNGGNDTESAIADEFGEILHLIRANKIKTRSIKYDYDPQDDNFVKNASAKYHVCRVTADMIANYSDFEKFFRELYKHEHFLEVSKIEIVPYQKNKKILLINVQIKLYAQKDPSSVVESPVSDADNNAVKPEAPPDITENAP